MLFYQDQDGLDESLLLVLEESREDLVSLLGEEAFEMAKAGLRGDESFLTEGKEDSITKSIGEWSAEVSRLISKRRRLKDEAGEKTLISLLGTGIGLIGLLLTAGTGASVGFVIFIVGVIVGLIYAVQAGILNDKADNITTSLIVKGRTLIPELQRLRTKAKNPVVRAELDKLIAVFEDNFAAREQESINLQRQQTAYARGTFINTL